MTAAATDPSSVVPEAPEFDIAIIGGGPAGLSAAVAAGRMNRRAVCFETGTPRTAHAPRYYNYLGFKDGVSGKELLRVGRAQARRWGCELRDDEVTSIVSLPGDHGEWFALRTGSGEIRAAAIIFATGIEDRQPHCGNLYGENGIHYCVVCDGFETRGERVAVIGHDSRAFSMLSALRDFTDDLHLLLDGEPNRMAPEEVQALDAWGVRVHPEELGPPRCSREGAAFPMSDGGEVLYPHVFVALGARPRTRLARDLGCELDAEGFIVTDERQSTSVPFVFAAGDCDGGYKQVTQAMAEGELAALEVARLLRDTIGPAVGTAAADSDKAVEGRASG